MTAKSRIRSPILAKLTYRAHEPSYGGYARIDLRVEADSMTYVLGRTRSAARAGGGLRAAHAGASCGQLLERIMAPGLQWQPHRMAIDRGPPTAAPGAGSAKG